MRFSVVIPCHNAERYIGQALQSVAAQTLVPHEVLVVDDGSTDGSMRVVRDSGLDITCLTSDARNAAATRNVGIDAATGDWIAFLDADDWWEPDHLKWAAELLDGSGDVGLLANHHWYNDPQGQHPIKPSLRCCITEPRTRIPAAEFARVLSEGFHFGHSTEVLSLARLREVGGFDARTQPRRHDIELWLRVIAGRTWAWDSRPHATYRLDTPDSISKSLVACELYQLRALDRHLADFDTPAMHQLVREQAKRTLNLCFIDGDAEQLSWAKASTAPHLSGKVRLAYRVLSLCPPLGRALLRWRRDRIVSNIQQQERAEAPEQ